MRAPAPETISLPPSALEMTGLLRIHLVEVNHARVGPQWGTAGRVEGDYLHHLNLVMAGGSRVIQPDGPLEYRPGQAYWSPGNTPVARECDAFLETCYVRFRLDWLGGFDPFLDWPGRRHVHLGGWRGKLPVENWKSGREITVREAWQLRGQVAIWLTDAVPELDALLASHLQRVGRFAPVLSFVEQRLGADLRIEDLAQKIGLSGRAFSMAFTRALGISPKAHLSRRLNQEALRLVRGSRFTMREIADQLRFSDEYHFNRFFRKMNGGPPRRYRSSRERSP